MFASLLFVDFHPIIPTQLLEKLRLLGVDWVWKGNRLGAASHVLNNHV